MIRTLLAALLLHASTLIDGLDLPLMPGLAEQPDGRVVYDKPQGRILEILLEGDGQADAVRRYYASAATGLGWTADPPKQAGLLLFHRGADQLTVEAIAKGPRVTVRLLLEPRAK